MGEVISGLAQENLDMTKKEKEYYKAWAMLILGLITYAFALFGLIVFIKKLL